MVSHLDNIYRVLGIVSSLPAYAVRVPQSVAGFLPVHLASLLPDESDTTGRTPMR